MNGLEDDEEFDYEADPVPTASAKKTGPARLAPRLGGVPPARRAQVRPVARPQTGSPNTLLYMGMGFMGAVIVGLLGLIAVLAFQRPAGAGTGASAAAAPTPASGVIAPAPNAGAAAGTPPRMVLAEFKALYDDPAKRPIIIDVRGADAYAQEHIAGAISVPGSDLAAQLAKLPQDKLIVAYCQ